LQGSFDPAPIPRFAASIHCLIGVLLAVTFVFSTSSQERRDDNGKNYNRARIELAKERTMAISFQKKAQEQRLAQARQFGLEMAKITANTIKDADELGRKIIAQHPELEADVNEIVQHLHVLFKQLPYVTLLTYAERCCGTDVLSIIEQHLNQQATTEHGLFLSDSGGWWSNDGSVEHQFRQENSERR
jgi:hypothetical protein